MAGSMCSPHRWDRTILLQEGYHRRKKTTDNNPYCLFVSQERTTVTETFSMGREKSLVCSVKECTSGVDSMGVNILQLEHLYCDVGVRGTPEQRAE
jgi:hypothetical protein